MNWKAGVLFVLGLAVVVALALWWVDLFGMRIPVSMEEERARIVVELVEKMTEAGYPEIDATDPPVELVVRSGLVVVLPRGDVLNRADFANEVKSRSQEWQRCGVTLRPEIGVTFVELIALIDILREEPVEKIRFTGEVYAEMKGGR